MENTDIKRKKKQREAIKRLREKRSAILKAGGEEAERIRAQKRAEMALYRSRKKQRDSGFVGRMFELTDVEFAAVENYIKRLRIKFRKSVVS